MRLKGWASRAASAEAKGRSWEISRRGLGARRWRRTTRRGRRSGGSARAACAAAARCAGTIASGATAGEPLARALRARRRRHELAVFDGKGWAAAGQGHGRRPTGTGPGAAAVRRVRRPRARGGRRRRRVGGRRSGPTSGSAGVGARAGRRAAVRAGAAAKPGRADRRRADLRKPVGPRVRSRDLRRARPPSRLFRCGRDAPGRRKDHVDPPPRLAGPRACRRPLSRRAARRRRRGAHADGRPPDVRGSLPRVDSRGGPRSRGAAVRR